MTGFIEWNFPQADGTAVDEDLNGDVQFKRAELQRFVLAVGELIRIFGWLRKASDAVD